MTEHAYPFPEICAAMRCPLPGIKRAIDQAQGLEQAALLNARQSTDLQETEVYYAQAKDAAKSTNNQTRMLEDFSRLPKPDFCAECPLLQE